MNAEREACAYCGLPCAPTADPNESAFCCLGCRFAMAIADERGEVGQIRWTLTRLGLAIFFTMNVMLFAMALWSRDFFPPPPAREAALAATWDDLFRALCLFFATPVMLLLGLPLLGDVWRQLRTRRVTTDLLLLAGVVAAFFASLISYTRGSGHVYFEVACMVLVAITLGRWLEAVGKHKTTESLKSLESLMPDRLRKLTDTGKIELLPPTSIGRGDRIVVQAGDRIAVDGVVESGTAAIDTSVITGESAPIVANPGSILAAGSMDLDGEMVIRAACAAGEGTLASLIRRVQQATSEKNEYRKLADRVAAVFLPTVFVLSIAVCAWHSYRGGFAHGLQAGLAVVLVSCPCALGLATPLAVATAIGTAARHQVLFRDGDTIARLSAIRGVAFDKTGTLTSGTCEVAQCHLLPRTSICDVAHMLQPVLAHADHPHARALRRFLSSDDNDLASDDHVERRFATDTAWTIRTHAGCGIEALSPTGALIRLGRIDWLRDNHDVVTSQLDDACRLADGNGWTVTAASWHGFVQIVCCLREETRAEAPAMIESIRALGLTPFVLTGDDLARAEATCGNWDIEVRAEMTPTGKADAVEQFQATHGAVAMVGDGLNDTPALAVADVGISLQAASDLARQTADVCILGDNLGRIPFAIDLARQTAAAVRANLFWAFAYNTVGVGLAAGGYVHPVVAAVAMLGSSLFVIGRSLALSHASPGKDGRPGEKPRQTEVDNSRIDTRAIDQPSALELAEQTRGSAG